MFIAAFLLSASLSFSEIPAGMVASAVFQLAANEVYTGVAFKIGATPGVGGGAPTEFRLLRNGVLVTTLPGSTPLIGGEIVFDHPGLTVGNYILRVDAKNDGGTAASTDFPIVVKPLPAAPGVPTLLRLIRIILP